MSLDWPWLVVLALVVPPALGHLYHFVLLINVGSGLGLREPVMDKVRELLFAVLVDLVGALALDAPAYAMVELGMAALELCRVVRGLGHADLAGQLPARHPASSSDGHRRFVRDARPGPASRNATP